jgi:hypothetical protein
MAYPPEERHSRETRELLQGMLQMSLIMGITAVISLNGSKMLRDPSVSLTKILYYGADMVLSASLRLYLILALISKFLPLDALIPSLLLVSTLAVLNALVSCIPIIFS